LVLFAPGDFPGIFSGKLRYVDLKPSKAIRGPVLGLWLDNSDISGKLDQIKIAIPGEKKSVYVA
jgi:hypothetical protein